MSPRRRLGWPLAILIALTSSVTYAGILDFFVKKNTAAPTTTTKSSQSRTTSGYSGNNAKYSSVGSRTTNGYNGSQSPNSPNGSRTSGYQPTKTHFWK